MKGHLSLLIVVITCDGLVVPFPNEVLKAPVAVLCQSRSVREVGVRGDVKEDGGVALVDCFQVGGPWVVGGGEGFAEELLRDEGVGDGGGEGGVGGNKEAFDEEDLVC